MGAMRIVSAAVVFLGVLAMMVSGASAQAIPVSIDEMGNGNIAGAPFPGVMGLDPGPGGLVTLLYVPPPGVGFVPGDVLIFEPGPGMDVLSDVVRFNLNGPVAFYSDNSDPDPAPQLADVGFPAAFLPNTVQLMEVGPEGNNGVIYTPTPNQPGFVPGFAVTYTIISDPVPEPGTIALLAGGGLGLAAFAWRRRK